VISSIEQASVPLILGRATLTMLESSTAMMVPVRTAAVTSHLLGGVAAAARGAHVATSGTEALAGAGRPSGR
jgi:hypothetical protein